MRHDLRDTTLDEVEQREKAAKFREIMRRVDDTVGPETDSDSEEDSDYSNDSEEERESEEEESEVVGDVARVRACRAGAKPKRVTKRVTKRVIAKRAPRPYKQIVPELLRKTYRSGERPIEAVSTVVASTGGKGVITERKVKEIQFRQKLHGNFQDTTDSEVAHSYFRSLLIVGRESDGKKGDSNGVKYAGYCKALMDTPGGFASVDDFVMANEGRARVLAEQCAKGKNSAKRDASNHMCGFRRVCKLLEMQKKEEVALPVPE
jgi:hypothetical protein